MEVRIPFLKRQVHCSWRKILPVLASAIVLLLALLAVLEAASDPAIADITAPDVGGTLPGTQHWTPADNPHVVTETVIVPADATLFVSPGVEVYFDQDTGIQVAGDGRLQAEGTAADPILFTAHTTSPSRGYWERIFFDDTALASTLSYCLVEYAGTGVAVGGDTDFHTIDNCIFRDNGDDTDWTSGGAIHSAGDELTITNNELYDNELGIRLRKSFGDIISGNVIHDNDGFGIGFLAAAAPGGGNNTITENEIYGNGGFGLGFVSEDNYEGGNNNQILSNDIHDTVAAGGYAGDGLYLDVGVLNTVAGNSINANEGHGVWAMSQEVLEFTENIVRDNGLNGLTISDPGTSMTIHSNVLCNNAVLQIENRGRITVTAEGNWFGTNTPGAGEISSFVDYTPWIVMELSVAPNQLPADGLSTATLTLTMNDGAGHSVPDGYPVDVTVSEGSLSASTLYLTNGQATATYTAGTTAGPVEFQATDGCGTLTFDAELELLAVDLAIDKTGPGGTTRPGELVTFTIDVSELNGVDARDVVITDDLPAGALWFSDTSASCGLSRQQPTPSTVVWTKDLWLADESCQFDLTVLVGGDACLEETLVNHVEITSTTDDDDLTNNSDTTTIDSPAVVCLDLAVAKDDGAGAVLVWQPEKAYVITYTVTYSNEGYVDATGVTLTDILPDGSQVYAANGWDCPDGTCTYTVGALAMGARQTAPPLVVEVLRCGDLRNEVTIGDDGLLGPDFDPADNTAVVTTSVPCLPDLRVVKNDNVGPTEPTPDSAWALDWLDPALLEAAEQRPCVHPGELITYSIAYANTGVETATQVVLTEVLPEYTTYVGGGWTCEDHLCTLEVEDLPPGAGGKADFIVHVDEAPPDLLILNEVHIISFEPDRDMDDNASFESTPVCEVCLEVSKDDNLPCAFPGDEIRYTIAFTNVCDVEATGVVLTETLPAYTQYLETPGWTSVGGDQYSYAYGSLAAGASDTVEFVVVVDDPLPDTVTETTDVVCIGRDGSTRADDCFTLVTPLPLVADLRVVKHDHIGPPPPETDQQLERFYQVLFDQPYEPSAVQQEWEPVRPGDVYSYTITYLNLGRAPATGIVLTETIPAQTTYVGYGWTHVVDNVYTRPVGDLDVRQGGQVNIWVRVNPDACGTSGYLYNWVHIAGDVEECNLSNNWSGEETPVEYPPCEGAIYLPVIMKEYEPYVPPTPITPTPTPRPEGYVSDVAVNPETNRVYVASPPMDAVFAVDPTGDGSVIDTIPVGDRPSGLAVVTTTNKIYAANFGSWTVTAIRGSDHTRLADIYAGAQACKVAADSDDARVYVANHLEIDNGAAAINSQTDEFLYYYTRLHATQGRYGIDLDPAAEKLFIAARDAGLIVIQDAFWPDQEPVLVKLDPPRVPFVVAFNPTTEHLFVTAPDDNLVVVLDPYSIQWNRASWTTWQGRPVFVLDSTNAGWIAEIGVGRGAEEGIAVNPLTGYVYVTNADSDTVSILLDDPVGDNIDWVMDVQVGEHPQGVAVDPTRNLIYVGNAWSRDLTVIDGSDHTIEKTIPLY